MSAVCHLQNFRNTRPVMINGQNRKGLVDMKRYFFLLEHGIFWKTLLVHNHTDFENDCLRKLLPSLPKCLINSA